MTNFFRRVFAPSPSSGDCSRSYGFTLIEMSVVLAIASALTAGALGAYRVMIAQEYLRTTKDRMTQIQQAMVRFQSDALNNPNQHLPCPAPLRAAPGTAAFGAEDVDTAGSLNCSTTVVGTTPHDDTFRATDGSLPLPNTVRIGGVPWKTLGIPMQTAYDAWGHRFLYAVSENLADPDPAPAYNAANGVITIKGPSTAGTPLPDKAPFVLISFGKSGFGSVTSVGKNFPIACPVAGTPERDNCDWAAPDTVFGERTYSEAGSPGSHFDDYIVHTLDNIEISGAAGANYIDKLTDGISDWPVKPPLPFNQPDPLSAPVNSSSFATNVFLGNNSGAPKNFYTSAPGATGGGNTSAGINNFAFIKTFPNNQGASVRSTALGMEALAFNNSPNNTASGAFALYNNRNFFVTSNDWGYNNTATGAFALYANAYGYENTATGTQALFNNQYVENTATGVGALYSNTGGLCNTATGALVLYSNTGSYTDPNTYTGSYNTAIGGGAVYNVMSPTPIPISALYNNTTGNNNTAVGIGALFYNPDSSDDTAVGYQALYFNATGGINNTAIGAESLYSNTSGASNTAAGVQALFYNQAKSGSTAAGYQALHFADDTAAASDSNNTAVGYQALYGNAPASANYGIKNTAAGSQALFSNRAGADNTAAGANALHDNTDGANNTAVGDQALYKNDTGSNNTAVGAGSDNETSQSLSALYHNTTGNDNTAIGMGALTSNVGGGNNTATGAETQYANISGSANTAMGGEALHENTDGNNNTAVGYQALYYADDTTTAINTNNTGVGYQAMYQNTGVENTAVGSMALSSSTPVNYNTAAGYGAGVSGIPPGGDYNTFIGYMAAPSWDDAVTNSTAIGANALVIMWNTVQLGDSNVTDVYFGATGGSNGPNGDTSPFTGTNIATVHAGHYNSPSDLRLKKNIKDSDLGLDFIEKLRPVSYRYKTGGKPMSYGFIAQEVEKALGDRATSMVTRQNDKMKTYELSYSEIISPLVRAVQEFVMNMLDTLEKTVADLGARFSPVEEAVQKHQLSLAQHQEQLQSLLKSMSGMKDEMDALKAGK